jgi:predicted MFS family arabinose efflux permease
MSLEAPTHSDPRVAATAAPALGAYPASNRFTHVAAVACGLSVANLYYNQPLLADMARTFGVTVRGVGSVPTLTQLGYAAGLLMIVPLGDVLQRRRLVVTLLVAVALALAAAAAARSLNGLAAASLAVGVTTVVPQVLLPLAAQLARPERRGKAVGTVMMGLLLGILLSRTVSGFVGERFGWRAMYWVASAIMILLALALGPLLPAHEVHADLTYAALLRSVVEQVRRLPVLRQAMLNGALIFAAFSAFWATLVFRMEAPPFHYGARAAGMYGLVGAAGAAVAPAAGRWADRVAPRSIITAATSLLLASFVVLWAGGSSLAGLAAGVFLLDVAVQAAQVTNLTRIYRLSETAHSRINSAFMVVYFLGGAGGSILGASAWSVGRWPGVCALGVALSAVALAAHLMARAPAPRPAP